MEEVVPLLQQKTGSVDDNFTGTAAAADTEDYAPVKSVNEAATVFCVETAKLWKIAAPIVFNILCVHGIETFTTIFAGHIGEVALSAVTVSISVITTFSFGFMLGMASALETLCGQAFGAGQVHMLGIYMQRSWIILSFCCLILLPVYIYAGPILKLLGQDHDIADIAGKFTIFTIPNLFSLAINLPTQKFLQSQSKVGVMAWIGFVALVAHILMLSLFIPVLGWGLIGAAAAFNITNWGITVTQLVYVFGWCKDSWSGFSGAAFTEIWAFLRLSFASALMLCLELWYIPCIVLLSGHLDNAVIAVGSLSICTNVDLLQAMIFIGINGAISVRVSNELGLGHPRTAKYCVFTTVFQSLLLGLLCMVVILIARNHFAIIFTDSKELQQAVADLAWLLGITMVLNSVQPVISGVAIGGGWQGLVAYINLGSYYVLGAPLGFVLGYVAHFGVEGIWGGLIIGLTLQTFILLFILYRTNWSKEVEETNSRMQKWGGQNVSTNKIFGENCSMSNQAMS